ncbi:THO complex subunit 4A [Madurella mycetomatis]|uniref:THO complex subunit 4A n=1 Tax=Madurella mycetomatis TaxID=100816 RepID=A0A175VRG9_9PEZI|nr:THO complex subunit 4A [Madurella mycetomatis]
MDRGLDRSLDEILAERKQSGRSSRGNRGSNSGRRRDRSDYPRDGVRKVRMGLPSNEFPSVQGAIAQSHRFSPDTLSDVRDAAISTNPCARVRVCGGSMRAAPDQTARLGKPFRDDAPRNLDSEWVHDKFEDHGSRRSAPRRRYSPEPASDSRGTKLRVDNVHYELTQEDLEGLFTRIGPVIKVDMKYDRAGRSEGTAFVTYESHRDATEAIREFDGANAAGQPIRLTLLPSGPRRNPFDSAVVPGRPLAERITVPDGRSRSLSPRRESDEEAARRGVDRYRPGGGKGSRSRSPLPGRRRDGGRRPGARRDGAGGRRGDRGERTARDGRPRKTQEELDAEMEDYFGGGNAQQDDAPAVAAVTGAGDANGILQQQQQGGDDIDMIE